MGSTGFMLNFYMVHTCLARSQQLQICAWYWCACARKFQPKFFIQFPLPQFGDPPKIEPVEIWAQGVVQMANIFSIGHPYGPIDQLGRSLPWHGRGREFKPKANVSQYHSQRPCRMVHHSDRFTKLTFVNFSTSLKISLGPYSFFLEKLDIKYPGPT